MIAAAKREVAERLLAAPRPTGEAGWAAKARAAAEARLTAMGGPVKRDEYWKYTDPAPLMAGGATDGAHAAFDALDAVAVPVGGAAPQVAGVEAATLKVALAADLGFARELFGTLEAAGHEKVARPLAALNTARATEGFALRVTGTAEKPLHIVNGPAMAHHVVRVESGASASIVETGLAANTVMEIDLAPGARLDHVRVQEGATTPGATHVFARVAEGADLRSFTLSADGALTRNEIVADLQGDDARAHVGGAVLGKGDSHIDNTVFVTHSALRGESRQVFKNVIDGRARAVFQGKIFVRKDAQKTDGYQISQSILLSPTAEFDVKPELEIYADDVKCSHGSTTGAMDADAMFYLQARGVPRRQAEALLVAAFVDEAVAEIADEGLAELVRARVAAWMAAR
jgi:Fe-S cluster assembly protein SufD